MADESLSFPLGPQGKALAGSALKRWLERYHSLRNTPLRSRDTIMMITIFTPRPAIEVRLAKAGEISFSKAKRLPGLCGTVTIGGVIFNACHYSPAVTVIGGDKHYLICTGRSVRLAVKAIRRLSPEQRLEIIRLLRPDEIVADFWLA